MRRALCTLSLFLAAGLPAAAEEIALRDGTKIVGHMTAIQGDKIEVETAYGKMQLKRADIITISFPENSPSTAALSPASKDTPQNIDETLRGTQYINKTGKFTLTLPTDWKINPKLPRTAPIVAGLSSHDELRFLTVTQEDYSGSLEATRACSSSSTAAPLAVTKNFPSQPSKLTADLPCSLHSAEFHRKRITCPWNSLLPLFPQEARTRA